MSNFSEAALIKKLGELNPSQQSIQTLSLWLIHHRKHHQSIVKVWYKELTKAKENRKLTFMYLANDVIQNSKKKGPEFGKEFGNVLKNAFAHLSQIGYDDKFKKSLDRLLTIWGERGVYEPKQIEDFRHVFGFKFVAPTRPPPRKKVKVEIAAADDSSPSINKNSINNDSNSPISPVSSPNSQKSKSPVKEHKRKSDNLKNDHNKNKNDNSLEKYVKLSPHTPAGDPPEPEELIKALQELENSASSDAVVRERIASLPPEVSEISYLMSLEDKESVERLNSLVNEALILLTEYNQRLSSELEDRKKLAVMLKEFTIAQQELLVQAEQRLEEYTEKLQKVHAVKQEVKSHIQNLPDLTQLPDVTGGLAPLPSAGDLFRL